jgi:glycosyltransferase involved in cell wall biosynthesis
MKMLMLTQYFPPEVGAPQNRLFENAVRWQKMGLEIDILTAMPNYPKMEIHQDYKGKWYSKEQMDGLTVFRSWIFVSKSKSIVFRLMNYFSFVFSSMFVALFKLKKYDVVFVESPPLFLGISARFICRIKGAKMIFNVSDLWPESAEKLGLVTNKTFLKMATILEEHLYKRSAIITGQTQGIVKDIQTRFPDKKVYWLPNGVNLNLYDPEKKYGNWKQDNGFKESDVLFVYAGIIGHAQGLEVILKAADKLKSHSNAHFILVGSGPEKEMLLQLKSQLNLTNVHFYDAVSKAEMPAIIQACAMTIVPLKKLDLFKGAIPSKIFENLSMKVPVILGVDGEARDLFVEDGKCALYFEPENADQLSTIVVGVLEGKVDLTTMKENARKYVGDKFDRDKIAIKFWEYLNSNIK